MARSWVPAFHRGVKRLPIIVSLLVNYPETPHGVLYPVVLTVIVLNAPANRAKVVRFAVLINDRLKQFSLYYPAATVTYVMFHGFILPVCLVTIIYAEIMPTRQNNKKLAK